MYFTSHAGNVYHIVNERDVARTVCGHGVNKIDLLMHRDGNPASRVTAAPPDGLPLCQHCQSTSARPSSKDH